LSHPLQLVKSISGGEKRRLSLAVELLSDPDVLYADEPLCSSLFLFPFFHLRLTFYLPQPDSTPSPPRTSCSPSGISLQKAAR
jgi:hypothetical protein